jgi:hypothetical protein
MALSGALLASPLDHKPLLHCGTSDPPGPDFGEIEIIAPQV